MLSPGNKTSVTCTAYIWDYNTFTDLSYVNGTLWFVSTSTDNAADDSNIHYTNKSCNLNDTILGSTTNGTFSCLFGVDYYANNGSWRCNLTVSDPSNLTSSNDTPTYVETLLAISVPSNVTYGNAPVNSFTGSTINISNIGNVIFNATVWGYGGNSSVIGNETAFLCELGNISVGWHRFSTNLTANFSDMENLSYFPKNISFPSSPVMQFFQRTQDLALGNDTNSTLWKVYIPNSIGGYCNGTLIFSAIDASI